MLNKRRWVYISLSALVVSGFLAAGYSLLQPPDQNEGLSKKVARQFTPPQADTKPAAQDSIHTKPQLRYPNIIGATYKHEDYTDLDEQTGLRQFSIPKGNDGSFYLRLVYQSSLPSHLDTEMKITWLADSYAAFSDIFQHVLGSTKYWESIAVHVGGFAQDYCGENIEIIYTLNSAEVFALFIDNSNRDAILKDSQCPLMPELLPPDSGLAFGEFCNKRESCLRNYFANPANRNMLQSEFIKTVSELQIK